MNKQDKNKRNISQDIQSLAKDLEETTVTPVEVKKLKGKSLTWDTEKEAYLKAIFDDYYEKHNIRLNFSQTILLVLQEYCNEKGLIVDKL